LSTDEKNAYKALIEGCSAKASDDVDNLSDALDDLKKSFGGGACNDNSAFYVNDVAANNNACASSYSVNHGGNNNPLPLPPKSASLYAASSGKRHVRKNPLILPSSRVTNLVSRSESVTEQEVAPQQQVFNLQASFRWRFKQIRQFRHSVDFFRLGPIFKIFSPKNSAKKLAFLTRNKAKLCKNLIITMFVFEKNAVFFAENRRKLAKIAENCGHNIDPWSPCSTLSASFRAKQ
jgi:hypothetical protein